MHIEWKDPSWFRTWRGWALSWWNTPKNNRNTWLPNHRITVLGVTIFWIGRK